MSSPVPKTVREICRRCGLMAAPPIVVAIAVPGAATTAMCSNTAACDRRVKLKAPKARKE